jgi:hypothetical protein
MQPIIPDKKFTKKIKEERFNIEIYYKQNRSLQENKEFFLSIINDVTRDAWEEPSDLVKKWFDLLDILVIAKQKDIVCGFVIGNFMEEDFVLLVSSMVRKNKQSIGLGLFINSIIINEGIKRRLFSFGSIFKIFKSFYFAFRTPNPILCSMVSSKTGVFPSMNRQEPTKKEIEIFDEIVSRFSPQAQIDKDNFIIKGAYLNYPKLIYEISNIPWSNNDKLNKFLDRRLKLTNREGNTMVIIGRVSFLRFIKNLL